MRILQLYDLNPLWSIGGVEHSVLGLSKELARLGHEVSVLTLGGHRLSSLNGITVRSIAFHSSFNSSCSAGSLSIPRQLLFLFTLLLKDPDLRSEIYHGHVYSSGLAALYLARRHGGIAVNTVHGSYYPVWGRIKDPFQALLYRAAERRLATYLARKTELQIHVSTYFAEQVASWSGCESRIKVIPNGVDPELFSPGVEPLIECSAPVVLTARRLVKKNGVEHLVKAMDEMDVRCRLVIAGDGPEMLRLRELAGDRGDIHFLGAVPHSAMPGLIASADIAVVPSLIEASSLFMLEAMAMERPVIASNVGGLPEVLGQAGLLVQPASPPALARAIEALLSDERERRRLGRIGFKKVRERYTWKKIARIVEAEYERLAAERES